MRHRTGPLQRMRASTSHYTIRDIARQAKVSLATVSRAINSPDVLRPETLRKVNTVIQRVGYRPNRIASSLKSRRTRTVGIVVSDLWNPFFVGIVKSAERALSSANYTAIVCDSEEDPDREPRYLDELLARRIDGLVLIPALEHNALPHVLKGLHIPTVFPQERQSRWRRPFLRELPLDVECVPLADLASAWKRGSGGRR